MRPDPAFLSCLFHFFVRLFDFFKASTYDDTEILLKKLTGFIVKITPLSLLAVVDKTGTKFAETIFDGIDKDYWR